MLDVSLSSEQRERYARLRASLKPERLRGAHLTVAGVSQRQNVHGRYARLLASLKPQKPQSRYTAKTEIMSDPGGENLSVVDE